MSAFGRDGLQGPSLFFSSVYDDERPAGVPSSWRPSRSSTCSASTSSTGDVPLQAFLSTLDTNSFVISGFLVGCRGVCVVGICSVVRDACTPSESPATCSSSSEPLSNVVTVCRGVSPSHRFAGAHRTFWRRFFRQLQSILAIRGCSALKSHREDGITE